MSDGINVGARCCENFAGAERLVSQRRMAELAADCDGLRARCEAMEAERAAQERINAMIARGPSPKEWALRDTIEQREAEADGHVETIKALKAELAASSLKVRWQEPLADWQTRELPCEDVGRQRLRLALGVSEEAGEVARCVLKADQDIRGGAEVWRDKLGGEIGDVVIYLIQLATACELDFEACVEASKAKVLARRFASAPKKEGES